MCGRAISINCNRSHRPPIIISGHRQPQTNGPASYSSTTPPCLLYCAKSYNSFGFMRKCPAFFLEKFTLIHSVGDLALHQLVLDWIIPYSSNSVTTVENASSRSKFPFSKYCISSRRHKLAHQRKDPSPSANAHLGCTCYKISIESCHTSVQENHVSRS